MIQNHFYTSLIVNVHPSYHFFWAIKVLVQTNFHDGNVFLCSRYHHISSTNTFLRFLPHNVAVGSKTHYINPHYTFPELVFPLNWIFLRTKNMFSLMFFFGLVRELHYLCSSLTLWFQWVCIVFGSY